MLTGEKIVGNRSAGDVGSVVGIQVERVAAVGRSLAEVPLKLLVIARLEVGENVWRVVLQAVVKLKVTSSGHVCEDLAGAARHVGDDVLALDLGVVRAIAVSVVDLQFFSKVAVGEKHDKDQSENQRNRPESNSEDGSLDDLRLRGLAYRLHVEELK